MLETLVFSQPTMCSWILEEGAVDCLYEVDRLAVEH